MSRNRKKKIALAGYRAWTITCLVCGERLSTSEGKRPSTLRMAGHFSQHGVHWADCKPQMTDRGTVQNTDGSVDNIYESTATDENGREVAFSIYAYGLTPAVVVAGVDE